MSDDAPIEPGWYPDPDDEEMHRYWDGSSWSRRAPTQIVAPTDEPVGDDEPSALRTLAVKATTPRLEPRRRRSWSRRLSSRRSSRRSSTGSAGRSSSALASGVSRGVATLGDTAAHARETAAQAREAALAKVPRRARRRSPLTRWRSRREAQRAQGPGKGAAIGRWWYHRSVVTRRVLISATVVGVIALIIALLGVDAPIGEEPPPREALTTTTTEAPTLPSLPDLAEVEEETRIVGQQIRPGRYIAYGQDGCYWERRSTVEPDPDAILGNDNVEDQQPFIVDVLPTDAVLAWRGCTIPAPYQAPERPSVAFFDGTHVVNEQVLPGTYIAPGSDSCYWERLSGFTGDQAATIESGLVSGQVNLVIQPTDVGIHTIGCGEFTLVG